jgi:two-component system phosphate regulon sensor histidine kinase PhoR
MEANHGIALTETDSNGATRQVVVFSSEMRQQAYDYREQVQRVVKELVASRMPIRRRVDSTSVHRLLRRHLAEAGLATELEFAFVINDPSECQRLAGDSAQLSSADQIVSAPLFPDRLETGRSATLSVGFWGTRRTVWANMAGLLGLTALLVAGVGLGFVYTLRTIRRQKRIDQMKDDFLDNLTHELKTPVATLRLAGEALAAQPALGPDRVTRYANIVSHESQRLQTHLERVLTLAEQERGGVRLEPTWVDLAQLAEEVAGCYRLRATEKGGTLEVKAVGDPKLLTAWVDRHLMTSVLENLLDNALKYNEKEPRISVTLSRIPGAVQLSVCDNGIGMKPETLRHAFDKFYRQHSGNRHTYKGFGIGLSLCRQVVEAHGGKIMAESQPGVGSTFCVHLPSPA